MDGFEKNIERLDRFESRMGEALNSVHWTLLLLEEKFKGLDEVHEAIEEVQGRLDAIDKLLFG